MIHHIASLYNEYIDDLYAYALHLGFNEDMSMDAIHDVFYKLCINSRSLDNISNIKLYLFRALRNRLIDIYRANKEYTDVHFPREKSLDELPFQLNVTIEDELIDKENKEEIRQKVEKILSNLTDRQREIIYLRYIHECDYEEIAELMNISVAACRNLTSKSLNKLKNLPLSILFLLTATQLSN